MRSGTPIANRYPSRTKINSKPSLPSTQQWYLWVSEILSPARGQCHPYIHNSLQHRIETRFQQMDHIRSATNFRVRQYQGRRKGAAQELRQRQCRPGHSQERGATEIDPTDKVNYTTVTEGCRQGKAQEVWEVGN